MVVNSPKSHAGSEAVFVLKPESSSHLRSVGCRLPAATSSCLKRIARMLQNPTTTADSNAYPIIPYTTALNQDNSSSRISKIGGSLFSTSESRSSSVRQAKSCNEADITAGRAKFVAPAQA